MLSGAMQTDQWLPVGVIILSTVLNAAYFLPIVVRAFFPEARPRVHAVGAAAVRHAHEATHGEAPWPMVLALVVTALATLVLFFVPDIPLALSKAMLAR
jgi:multicomponent Na+:H+ antiporter subunit D